ncbi:MAG: hypothetical protein KBT35_01630 [Firmicutes bacterium]|nr:hypothetical protein [Candidatus Colivicinus equi]
MFNSNGFPSLSDIAAVTNSNDGFGGNNGWWVLIILFAIFGGWGNGSWGGYGAGGVQENYILSSDFGQLSRQIDNGFSEQRGQGIQIANGISSLGYEQLGQMNNINTNILTTGNTLQAAVKDCCCQTQQNIKDTQYAIATNASVIDRTLCDKFCQTNFNMQTNTRDIIDNGRSDTQAILAKLDAMENSRKDEKIAEQQAMISDLKFAASQANQNNVLINTLRPLPTPCYTVANPWGCNCNYGQTVGYFGTTIA